MLMHLFTLSCVVFYKIARVKLSLLTDTFGICYAIQKYSNVLDVSTHVLSYAFNS